MDLQIKPHQVPLTTGLEAYIERRVGRLDRYLDRVTDAKLELREDQPRTGGVRHVSDARPPCSLDSQGAGQREFLHQGGATR